MLICVVLGAINCAFQGEVIEVGNHRELVEKGGRYAELWEHQQQEERKPWKVCGFQWSRTAVLFIVQCTLIAQSVLNCKTRSFGL